VQPDAGQESRDEHGDDRAGDPADLLRAHGRLTTTSAESRRPPTVTTSS
jgi:hypothetical protein